MTSKKVIANLHKSSRQEIQDFLDKVDNLPAKTDTSPGKLVFAIDATASRQATWDIACEIQASMFKSTTTLGGLQTQLCYYRGFHEFKATAWVSNAKQLTQLMTEVQCLGGHTQIERLLHHVVNESRQLKINAVIFIGDAIEEPADKLCNLAGQLGILSIPVFIFHEGHDTEVKTVFQQMAKLSNGAYCPFNHQSPHSLAALLGAIAVYASGGRKALEKYKSKEPDAVKLLTKQFKS